MAYLKIILLKRTGVCLSLIQKVHRKMKIPPLIRPNNLDDCSVIHPAVRIFCWDIIYGALVKITRDTKLSNTNSTTVHGYQFNSIDRLSGVRRILSKAVCPATIPTGTRFKPLTNPKRILRRYALQPFPRARVSNRRLTPTRATTYILRLLGLMGHLT